MIRELPEEWQDDFVFEGWASWDAPEFYAPLTNEEGDEVNGQIIRAVAGQIEEHGLTEAEARLKNVRHGWKLGTHRIVLTESEIEEAIEIADEWRKEASGG